MVQTRQTAYKVRIRDILTSPYYKEGGEWDPPYVIIQDKKISRVNLIATVVEKLFSDDGTGSLLLDDGSGVIKVRTWEGDVTLFKEVVNGDLALVIGKIRQYNGETHITPEMVRVLQEREWAKVRKLELEREFPSSEEKKVVIVQSASSYTQPFIQQPVLSTQHALRQKILMFIGKQEEVRYDDIVLSSGVTADETSRTINELLKEGEIYQSRPGFLKII